MADDHDRDDFVEELRRDLADGDDLAQAMSLIGDALHRRIRRVRRSLTAAQRNDGELVERVTPQIRDTLDRYERALQHGRDEMESIITSFQEELQQRADAIEDGD